MPLSVHIMLQKDNEKSISVCRVSDQGLIQEVARKAIEGIREKAKNLETIDPVIAQFQYDEADRLESFLIGLLPGLKMENG